MITYIIRRLDVFGNEADGFEFNDYLSSNEEDADLDEESDDAIVLLLIERDYIKGGKGWKKAYYVEDLGHGDGFCVNVCLDNGMPLFEVSRKAE